MRINQINAFLFSIITLGLLCGFTPNDAMAGCRINYEMVNMSQGDISFSQFKVKSKGGKWAKIGTHKRVVRRCHRGRGHVICRGKSVTKRGSNFLLSPSNEAKGIYNATFSCNAKRRYRFIVSNSDGCRKNIYYPSANGWTAKGVSDINFGDISRHCK